MVSNETNQLECFAYDKLNRLTSSHRYQGSTAVSGSCSNTQNIIDSESFEYDGRGNITEKDNQNYVYLTGSNNSITVSPHQVQSKGNQVFSYDANGNNTLMTNFVDQTGANRNRHISYTAYDKIKTIWTTDSNGNELASSEYRYDTDENRFYRKDTNAENETTVTHFIGNVEVVYPSVGARQVRRQLGNYAIIEDRGNTVTTNYLFNDHLGSVDVIIDAYGAVLERMSFSSWGEKRDPVDWNTVLPTDQRLMSSTLTTRGFTGHEMNDAFGIVNMGGRIYDANLGRVLQADPFVQEPTNSQSYNRYTYVFNNPLSYTDPSGYISDSMRGIIGAAVGIVLTTVLGPAGAAAGEAIMGAYAAAFWGGVAAGAIISGSFEGALISGLTAVATTFVGDMLFRPKADVGSVQEHSGGQNSRGGINECTYTNPFGESVLNTTSASGELAKQSAAQNSSHVTNEITNSSTDLVAQDTITVIGDPNIAYIKSELMIDYKVMAPVVQALANFYRSYYSDISNGNEVARKLEKVLLDEVPAQFISGQYDRLMLKGIDYANKASMVTGIFGLTKSASKFLLSKITNAEGFLIGSFTIRMPITLPVQRFGNMKITRADHWGLRVGESKILNRTIVAIKPEWNDLTVMTKGIIPKGTSVKIGIVGPQGFKYPGGSMQFLLESRSIIEQTTKIIAR